MAKLPEKGTKRLIDELEERNLPRPHLGGSVIGHPCRRYLVYSFYWAYRNRIESKLNRIFRIGDAIEDLVIKDLEAIGVMVDGSQEQVDGYMGHCGGSVDGILTNVPEYPDERLLFECKSANHTNFLDMQRKKIEFSKPQYYAQTQIYMGKLDLKRTLFAVVDKNTSELYIEFIDFDEDFFEHLLSIEQDVIHAGSINEFPRINTNPSWFMCKFCDAKDICHHGAEPEKTCRTCNDSIIRDDGHWECIYHGKNLSIQEQGLGCEHWVKKELFNEL